LEKQRQKEEQERRHQEERTKFIEKTKNLLIFEPVADEKPKKSSGGGGKVSLTSAVMSTWRRPTLEKGKKLD
jgi:hypothetical protein